MMGDQNDATLEIIVGWMLSEDNQSDRTKE